MIDRRQLDTTVKTTRASYDSAVAALERETIHRVAEDMSGHDANSVNAVLVSRLASRLPGAAVDHANLEKIASAIASGHYHGWTSPA